MQCVFCSFAAGARSFCRHAAVLLLTAVIAAGLPVGAAAQGGAASMDSQAEKKPATPAKKPARKAAGAGKSAAKPAGKATGKTAGVAASPRPPSFPASKVVMLSVPEEGALPVAGIWQPLMNRLAADGLDSAYLNRLFGRMGDSYSHVPMGTKVSELFTYKFVPRPPRPKQATPRSGPPPVYRSLVTPQSIDRCRGYLLQHAVAFAGMEAKYGVPKEVVAGLLMVETRLGSFLGSNSSFWSLACMASAVSPEHVSPTLAGLPLPMTPDKEVWLRQILRERSDWAYREILALARHGWENGIDPLQMPGSVYGAIGICQFMPSNLPKFAVDGNGDGIVDLFDPADAIASVGSYLKRHGWQGTERESRHAVLKRYNKSNVYANTILAIADALNAAKASEAAGKPPATPGAKTKQPAGKGSRKPAAGKAAPVQKVPAKAVSAPKTPAATSAAPTAKQG